jgi:hypothetical protein
MGGGVMRLHFVESSMLRRIGYDPYRRILVAQFREGNYYEYYDVPTWVFALVMSEDSTGRAFHDHILGRFEYRRIEERGRGSSDWTSRSEEDVAAVH